MLVLEVLTTFDHHGLAVQVLDHRVLFALEGHAEHLGAEEREADVMPVRVADPGLR